MMEPRQTGMFRGSDSNEVRALFCGFGEGKAGDIFFKGIWEGG